MKDEVWIIPFVKMQLIKFLSTSTHVYVDDYERGLNKKKNFICLFKLYRIDLLYKIE